MLGTLCFVRFEPRSPPLSALPTLLLPFFSSLLLPLSLPLRLLFSMSNASRSQFDEFFTNSILTSNWPTGAPLFAVAAAAFVAAKSAADCPRSCHCPPPPTLVPAAVVHLETA